MKTELYSFYQVHMLIFSTKGKLKSKMNSACFRRNRYDSMSHSTQIFSTTIRTRNITYCTALQYFKHAEVRHEQHAVSVMKPESCAQNNSIRECIYHIAVICGKGNEIYEHTLGTNWSTCDAVSGAGREYEISQGYCLSLV
jgi:hypothetical protein